MDVRLWKPHWSPTTLITSLIPRARFLDLPVVSVEMDRTSSVSSNPFAPVDTTGPRVFAAGYRRRPFDILAPVIQTSTAAARAARVMEDRR